MLLGKTTLANILSIETDATGGDISVFGYSVADSPDEVRGLVAVCKQFDFLYPDLSAKEHLELFGGLRGVAEVDLAEMVQKWLESVDLDIVQNQYSSSFSGGMKRRLSLACSTIGGRPLIILDEPTTGMDPLSRRYVWRHIDEVKEDRVILLTTHAMEEADLLADTVAVSLIHLRSLFFVSLFVLTCLSFQLRLCALVNLLPSELLLN